MRWKRQLTISPSGLFLPPADVEDEEGQKDKQDDASYTYAEDEVDIHTLLCKRNRDGMERRGGDTSGLPSPLLFLGYLQAPFKCPLRPET